MTTALAIADVARLAKLIRLIFGSDQPGEITAAVAAVRRTLEANNVDHHWLADRLAAPIALPACERDDRSAAWFCFNRRDLLSPKERAFICNVVERSAPLSPKQKQWLFDLVDRLEAAAA
jgi:hypothetical protein